MIYDNICWFPLWWNLLYDNDLVLMNIDIGRSLGIPISASHKQGLDLPCKVNMLGIPSDQ